MTASITSYRFLPILIDSYRFLSILIDSYWFLSILIYSYRFLSILVNFELNLTNVKEQQQQEQQQIHFLDRFRTTCSRSKSSLYISSPLAKI